MKKKITKKSYWKEVVAISVVAVLAVSLTAQANVSFLDRVANGVANLVFGELKLNGSLDSGELESEVLSFGAFPGPEVYADVLCVNGLCERVVTDVCIVGYGTTTAGLLYTVGTSTPMSILNPFNATATVKLRIEWTGSSTNAISYDVGTSTLPSPALTASIGDLNGSFIASTSIPVGQLGNFVSDATDSLTVAGIALSEFEINPTDYLRMFATTTDISLGQGQDGLRYRTTWGCRYSATFTRYGN